MQNVLPKLGIFGAGVYGLVGFGGGVLAKMDEGNWGACKICSCRNCKWSLGSYGAKYITGGMTSNSAYRRCKCGHHFTQHYYLN